MRIVSTAVLLVSLLLPIVSPGGSIVQPDAADAPPYAESPRPERSIRIGAKRIATLTPGGGGVEVVVAPDASRMTRYAADELCYQLGRRLEQKIPLVAAPSGGKLALIVGANRFSRAAGIDEKKLCRDSFIIKTGNNCVYILGIDNPDVNPLERGGWKRFSHRGSLFGVYDFLERFGGMRFYLPNELGTLWKPGPVIVCETDIFDRPDWQDRRFTLWNDGYFGGKTIWNVVDPKARMADRELYRYWEMLRMSTKFVPLCHGLGWLQILERFGKTNPEYFALTQRGERHFQVSSRNRDQLCFSSGVVDVIARDAEAVIRNESPRTRGIGRDDWGGPAMIGGMLFNAQPQDGLQPCYCDKCRPHFESPEKISELMWNFTAKLARHVKEKCPNGYVNQMAYATYRKVPSIPLPDNLLIINAVKGGPWQLATNRKLVLEERDWIRSWKRKTGRTPAIWFYAGKHMSLEIPDIPSSTPRAIGEYVKLMKDDTVGGNYESETDRVIFHYLNYYIFSKTAWDTSVDVDKLMREHCELMFGAGAAPMLKFYDMLENLWTAGVTNNMTDSIYGPRVVPPQERDIWEKVYSPERIAEMTKLFDEAEKLAASDAAALKRIRYIRREMFEPLQKGSVRYVASTDAVGAFGIGLPARLHLQPFKGKFNVFTQVAVDEENDGLKISYRCEEPSPEKCVAEERSRDDGSIWRDDSVDILLAVPSQEREYYQIIVNRKGVFRDTLRRRGGKDDPSWESQAKIKVSSGDKEWRAEIFIPWKALGGRPEKFRANFGRSRTLKGTPQEYYAWGPFLKSGFSDVNNFGSILLKDRRPRNLVENGNFAKVTPAGQPFGWGGNGGKWKLAGVPGSGLTVTKNTFVFGPHALEITGSGDKYITASRRVADVKPGRKYRISCFIRLDDVKPQRGTGGAALQIFDGKNRFFPEKKKLSGSFPWSYFSWDFTAGPGTRFIVLPGLFYASGKAFFSDVRIEEIQ